MDLKTGRTISAEEEYGARNLVDEDSEHMGPTSAEGFRINFGKALMWFAPKTWITLP